MAKISARNVYKIFGGRPELALPLLHEGRTKAQVQDETGQIIGVNDVSFELDSGSLFVIMGLSGSGKSTLLRCINRLVEPTSGEIIIESEGQTIPVTSLSASELRRVREQKLGMIFQHFALFPFRTVLSNVTFGLEIQGAPRKKREEEGRRVLELVGLSAWADSYPDQLSGGMQQRVGLARALASQAEILLMDEPFSALDPLIKVNMQDELLNLKAKVKRTILFVSHDLDEALKLGDKIAIMEEGRIVQIGGPEEIIVNPKTEYVAKFVEHADATGVLRAGTIALDLPIMQDPPKGLKLRLKKNFAAFAEHEDVVLALNEKGRPLVGHLDGQTLDVRMAPEDLSGINGDEDILWAASEEASVRQIMETRMNTGNLPVVIVDENGALRGVITEREILRGMLEKGRQENGEEIEEEAHA